MGSAPVAANILAIGELAPGRITLELRAPTLVAGLRPGHALHLVRAEAGGYRLRRVAPITKVDPLRGSVEVALQPRADGGRDSLADLRVGDALAIAGPIGRAISLDAKGSNLLLVSDTEGFAWLRLLAISAVSAGRSVVFIQEAQSAHELAPDRFEFAYRYAESFYDLEKPDWELALKLWSALEEKATTPIERQTMRLHAANILIKLDRRDHARALLATVDVPELQGQKQRLAPQLEAKSSP